MAVSAGSTSGDGPAPQTARVDPTSWASRTPATALSTNGAGPGTERLGPRSVIVVTFLLEECQRWECECPSYKE